MQTATVLVLGATGRTGRSLALQLLDKGHHVRAIVRSPQKLPPGVLEHPNASVVTASVLDLSDEELAEHARDCEAVTSCLGHVLSLKGMFGEPRRLCTEATQRLCGAIERNQPAARTKFILMSTVGVPNPALSEKRAWFERGLLTVLRHGVPPHRDNETAAKHLHEVVGKDSPYVEWCCVRPDSLTESEVGPYDVEPSPTTGIFSGRPTARANVAHFMAELIGNPELWSAWKFAMPVVMNSNETVD